MDKHQTTQNAPVIPFTDDASNDSKPTTQNNSTRHVPTTAMDRTKNISSFLPFSKPPKWLFGIVKILLTVLIPFLLNTPDIHLNIHHINIVF